MVQFEQWPEDLPSLLINDDGPKIYFFLEQSANASADYLNDVKRRREVDEAFIVRWLDRIKANLKVSGELRFKLKQIQNQIQRQKNTHFSYRRLATALKSQGKEDNNSLLFELMERQSDSFPGDIISFIENLTSELTESMRCRIEIVHCWETILDAARKVMVERLVILSHRLTEMAIQLQDEDNIQKVRSMLAEFQHIMPRNLEFDDLPDDPLALKQMLEDGIGELIEIRSNIDALDSHQKSLNDTRQTIEDLIEPKSESSPAASSGLDSLQPLIQPKGPSRMVYRKGKR